MTPSLPTFCIASAIIWPISASPFADTVPTCATSSEFSTLRAAALIWATTLVVARSMPRLRSIGFMPAATAFMPSLTMACARTVAVVVPSPASSLVRLATSLTICAPMFSNLSSSSISFATVTPSLVIRGAPKDFSITTLRPLGPSVTFTASARVLTPLSIRLRASVSNLTSLAMWLLLKNRFCGRKGACGSGDHAQDVRFLHDHQLFAVERHFRARPLSEENPVARLHAHLDQFARILAGAVTGCDDLAFRGLFLGGVGDDQTALGRIIRLDAADQHTVMQRFESHLVSSLAYVTLALSLTLDECQQTLVRERPV